MFPVSEDIFLRLKTVFLIHSVHKTAVEIDGTGKPDNDVLLTFFLYRLTCGACGLSDRGTCIAIAPRLLGGVCGYA